MGIGKTMKLCVLALLAGLVCPLYALDVKSPDGQVVISLEIQDRPGVQACPVYRVSYGGKLIVKDSRLGFELDTGALQSGLSMTVLSQGRHDTQWTPVYGERSQVRDHYTQADIQLQEKAAPHRVVQVSLRAYNEGVAFCYTLPKQPGLDRVTIREELTEFCFTGDHTAWATYSAQGRYAKTSLTKIKPGCERPLTLQWADQGYAAVGEARLVDYARMKLGPLPGQTPGLISDLSGPVTASLPLSTPWRVIMLAQSPGQLLENNDLILNLNEPCAIGDTAWIKPGKVIREVTLTTTGARACVDFAAAHGLQYVEFDAGWYGHEYSNDSDATTVSVDPKRSKGPLDLPAVIAYAQARNIGILLYVNRRSLERQLDEILPLFRSWGIKGVKYGFVNVGSQKWTTWLHEAVRKAADHQLMVDVHDEYRPTGYSRTYPNFMTQEGIAGDETSPVNEQTLTILFTRMLAGAADNTICYYDGRVARNASHAYQLAKAVCLYSPWQFVYWYDRPAAAPKKAGGAGGAQTGIGDEPELEFFDHVPTVWDDTKVIEGRVGEYAVMARKSGDNWFMGCMNSGKARTFEVPLDFLDSGKAYTAHVYADDPQVPTRTHVRIDRFEVNQDTVLKMTVSAQGGQAVRLVAQKTED